MKISRLCRIAAILAIALTAVPAVQADDWFRDHKHPIRPVATSVTTTRSEPIRPDDRSPRGPYLPVAATTIPAAALADGDSFDWRDAAIGVGVGITIALLAGGVLALGLRERHPHPAA